MSDTKIAQAFKLIEGAENNIRAAKSVLADLAGGMDKLSHAQHAPVLSSMGSTPGSSDSGRVVEGIFDGQNMTGADGKSYPVPANYASKSKLVEGDKLKLTIRSDGAFLYKQIGPIDRKRIIGRLMYENGQYFVVSEDKTYNVLLASVTYFKIEVGQTVALLVPITGAVKWAAVENSVVNAEAEAALSEAQAQEQGVTFDISKA
jgi:hypothetical protein